MSVATQHRWSPRLRAFRRLLVMPDAAGFTTEGCAIGPIQLADVHGLGNNHLDTDTNHVTAVTPDDVQATAPERTDPARMSIAIVGGRRVIDRQLGECKPLVA